MKALSIRQPWAYALLHMGKGIENRERADGKMPAICRHRGRLLLHASKMFHVATVVDHFASATATMRASDFQSPGPVTLEQLRAKAGGIVGVASAIAHVDPDGRCWLDPEGKEKDGELLDEMKTRAWHVPGSYGLVLADRRELPFTPWKGALGLFDVPDSVAGPLIARAA